MFEGLAIGDALRQSTDRYIRIKDKWLLNQVGLELLGKEADAEKEQAEILAQLEDKNLSNFARKLLNARLEILLQPYYKVKVARDRHQVIFNNLFGEVVGFKTFIINSGLLYLTRAWEHETDKKVYQTRLNASTKVPGAVTIVKYDAWIDYLVGESGRTPYQVGDEDFQIIQDAISRLEEVNDNFGL